MVKIYKKERECKRMKNSIEEKVIVIIYNIKEELEEKDINENSNFFKELNFDSIEIMQLIAELENTFQIQFKDIDELIEVMSNVKSVVEFVCKHIEERIN